MGSKAFLILSTILFLGSVPFCQTARGAAESAVLEAYPGPGGISPSPQYSVRLVQNGQTKSSFVYQSENPGFLSNGEPSGITTSSTLEQSTAWTTFSFSGAPVIVQITNSKPFTAARILPSHWQIVPAITGTVIRFSVSSPGNLAVDFCYLADGCPTDSEWDLSNPILVFSNPPQGGPVGNYLTAKPGSPVPPLNNTQSMVYFPPGVYELGQTPYVLGITQDGTAQGAFLAGGAYVRGAFQIAANAKGTKITGRGVLSGEEIPRDPCEASQACSMIDGTKIAGQALIQGITIVNSPLRNVNLKGVENTLRGIRIISWYANSGSFASGEAVSDPGSVMEGSFLKVGDDALILVSTNLKISGCTVWQLNNAAVFEFGANEPNNISNVTVQDTDVIRTETVYPNRTNAVFAANFGGNAQLNGYTFQNIHVENSSYQLFQLAIVPTIWISPPNNKLGSISNLNFTNITVSDPQTLPNLFQSFDRQHQISNVSFENVTVAGQLLPNPKITFNANRNLSLAGTIYSGLLWRSENDPATFQFSLFSGTNASNTPSNLVVTHPRLTKHFEVQTMGDFYGDDYASVLFLSRISGELVLWKDPVANTGPAELLPIHSDLSSHYSLRDGGFEVVGVGDFNGDGLSDILLWNGAAQAGKVLVMNGERIVRQIPFQPDTSSSWSVAGVGDFYQTGYSDILLRDTSGNIEVLYFSESGLSSSVDYEPANFTYSSTANYDAQWPKASGIFGANWNVVGVGDVSGNGYASIVWSNPKTGQVGITGFSPSLHKPQGGRVIAVLPEGAEIQALGDFNGDGTADLLLRDPATGTSTLWYMGWFNGDLYLPGPTLPSDSTDPNWQVAGEQVCCADQDLGSGGNNGPTHQTLQVDRTPAGITPSSQYTVQLKQRGRSVKSFVYQVQNPGFLPGGQPSGITSSSTLEQATSWTSFSFAGSVTVQVTNNNPFASARILPSHAQVVPTVSGNTVSFTLNQPGQFAIDFCTIGATCTEDNDTDLTNPMLVFANPIEADIPDPQDPNVLPVTPGLSLPSGENAPQLSATQNTLYFGPGIYDLGFTPLTIASDERVYLAAGAYVKGFFAFVPGASDAILQGRGIVSGENLPKAECIGTVIGCPDMVLGKGQVRNLVVEGLTFIQSPFYNISINGGGGNTVNNVKVIAWLGNSDGIQASFGSQDMGSVIENSFVKNGDDSIKLSGSNLLVQNCVVWKMNNAAAFQMGAGTPDDLTNITVQDSDVIRTEYAWPNTSTAVFAANEGGNGNLSNYTFEDIRVENASWQLFKILIVPSNFQVGNYQLGSISNLTFHNIEATDAQKFPPMFRGFNLAHQVSKVTFNNVVIAGMAAPNPTLTFDANRNMSYAGNTASDLLFRSLQDPANFEIPLFRLATPTTAPPFSLFSISQPNLTASFQLQGSGDFFGDGYASAVVTNTANGEVGIWKEPYRNSASPWSAQYSQIYKLGSSDGTVAGVGDFNGDGYSDILLWNSTTQTGKILLIEGDQIIGQSSFQPATASTWSVAAVADFNGNGYSDVLLRDSSGNLEVIYFGSSSQPTSMDFKVTSLGYSSTANYTSAYGKTSGHFDTTWSIAGAGIFQTLGTPYASLLWVNSSTGQVGMMNFTPFLKTPLAGQVFAKLPADTVIQAIGDFNGDGAKDLLLWNASTSENTIWFMNFDGGALYQVGPTLQPSLSPGWQVIPN